jgi:Kef-type K+ transport system membrane component KefB
MMQADVMDWLLHDSSTRFVAQVAVIVAAAQLVGRLARRIGQPIVVAEIVAGIALGPSVLGRLAPAISNALFPPTSLDTLRLVSQIGVLAFSFLIGLELEPAMLRGRLRAGVAISAATMIAPFVLGAALALPLGELAGPNTTNLGYALFLGTAMSITAFPVLARILAEHGLLRTRLGALAIACAAIDDAIAWCLLAFVIAGVRSEGLADAVATTVLAIAFVAFMWLVARPMLRRMVDHLGTPPRVTADAFALLLLGMLVSAWATERIGIHLIFGAFLFGVIVPKRDGFAHAVAEKLENFVIVLLLPLFFAVSGLRTHVDLVATASHAMACGAIVLVACVGKIGGGLLAARFVRLPWREAGALAILLNTRGLIELIAINMGFELGVFSPALFSMLVVMVLVTTFSTTPLLRRIYPTREAVHEMLVVEPPHHPHPRYRVLVCISTEHAGTELVTMAHALAGMDADMIALHLAGTGVDDNDGIDASSVLAPALERASELGIAARPLVFASTDPADDIVRIADVRDVDVVLLASQEPDDHGDFGRVVRAVLERAPVTIAVHVGRGISSCSRMLVPVIGSPDDRAALAIATRIQRANGAEITVLDVASSSTTHDAIALCQKEGGRVVVEPVAEGSSAKDVVSRGNAFDLIVVGISDDQPEWMLSESTASLLAVRGPLS